MKINPVQGIKGATVVFRGFAPHHYAQNPANDTSLEGIPFRPQGILLKDQPTPAEGVGTKLDTVA